MHPRRRAVMRQLRDCLHSLGVANDAQDHGSIEEAVRLRRAACEGIGDLLAKNAFLGELLPTLRRQLESGNIVGGAWSSLEDAVDAWLAMTGSEADAS